MGILVKCMKILINASTLALEILISPILDLLTDINAYMDNKSVIGHETSLTAQ